MTELFTLTANEWDFIKRAVYSDTACATDPVSIRRAVERIITDRLTGSAPSISPSPTPGPWSISGDRFSVRVDILGANGAVVASSVRPENAHHIIDALREADRG